MSIVLKVLWDFSLAELIQMSGVMHKQGTV